MEEGGSTRGPTDFEETLILTLRIGLWKSKSLSKTSRIINKCSQHTTRIFTSISIFCLIVHPSNFLFRMGGTVEKWNDPNNWPNKFGF